ncbi:Neuronal acetylcholine receptor subunit alpha-7 [Frankliniella fusca]|uniref:Neuronal acetylcholine receptor subunit alpha-7 n=1 Tax=Frankliniella fusca TaxID=407009 RepID=A0AAE1GUM4_9NEOP|nr:Neuronal acetylcholine receptor subunit alpha-7 [Frankliniella fusca]
MIGLSISALAVVGPGCAHWRGSGLASTMMAPVVWPGTSWESLQGPHEKRLLHSLLDHYNVLERPVANESDPLQLSFGLTLMQIIDVVSTFENFYRFYIGRSSV